MSSIDKPANERSPAAGLMSLPGPGPGAALKRAEEPLLARSGSRGARMNSHSRPLPIQGSAKKSGGFGEAKRSGLSSSESGPKGTTMMNSYPRPERDISRRIGSSV